MQEAYLRAFRSFERYRGGDPRAWLLTIVRNTCFTWLRQNREAAAEATASDEVAADPAAAGPDCRGKRWRFPRRRWWRWLFRGP